MYRALFLVALIAGCALGDDTELNFNSVKANVPGLENFNEADLPQREEVEKVLREKCEKNGGKGAYEDITNMKDSVQECLSKYLNQTVIMDELELAKKDGSMDDVFGKYCKQRKQIMDCVTDVTAKVEKCLEPKEKENMKMVLNITDNLIDFVCFKDGDRLAMFVAEGGFECLQDHREQLQDCANKTFSNRIPQDVSLQNLPMLTFSGDRDCADMQALQECAVAELEKCDNNTPANIVEALFKFIKKVSPCKEYKGVPIAQRKTRVPQDAQNNVDAIIGAKVKRSQPMDFTSVDSFRDKCTKYAGPKAFTDLSISVNETKLCIQTLLRQENACQKLVTEGKLCVSRTMNKLRVCLPPQESYLPAFAMASVDNGLKYLCDHDGYNYKRFMHGLPCMISSTYGSELSSCMANTKTRRTSDNAVVSKGELCEDMDRIKVCLSTYITNRCSHMKDLKETTMEFVEAVKDPCAGVSIYANITLLLCALMFYVARNEAFVSN